MCPGVLLALLDTSRVVVELTPVVVTPVLLLVMLLLSLLEFSCNALVLSDKKSSICQSLPSLVVFKEARIFDGSRPISSNVPLWGALFAGYKLSHYYN